MVYQAKDPRQKLAAVMANRKPPWFASLQRKLQKQHIELLFFSPALPAKERQRVSKIFDLDLLIFTQN